ncbi:hypothetical protein FHR81_000991 [Actinoalloteichus hoggarensis]|uniref:Uncharacterized protein n=1 Tax=Actinoalloteichus hoggarensis TaxID=1470176 RepID=A0A221VZ13_9PSEU|nr:hypothetical protein AHOG_05375 [Actinoalloteichus hoggarensis]MBB5919961.1 hypothetical protein [Actinoalloteichus hoggarensis]
MAAAGKANSTSRSTIPDYPDWGADSPIPLTHRLRQDAPVRCDAIHVLADSHRRRIEHARAAARPAPGSDEPRASRRERLGTGARHARSPAALKCLGLTSRRVGTLPGGRAAVRRRTITASTSTLSPGMMHRPPWHLDIGRVRSRADRRPGVTARRCRVRQVRYRSAGRGLLRRGGAPCVRSAAVGRGATTTAPPSRGRPDSHRRRTRSPRPAESRPNLRTRRPARFEAVSGRIHRATTATLPARDRRDPNPGLWETSYGPMR